MSILPLSQFGEVKQQFGEFRGAHLKIPASPACGPGELCSPVKTTEKGFLQRGRQGHEAGCRAPKKKKKKKKICKGVKIRREGMPFKMSRRVRMPTGPRKTGFWRGDNNKSCGKGGKNAEPPKRGKTIFKCERGPDRRLTGHCKTQRHNPRKKQTGGELSSLPQSSCRETTLGKKRFLGIQRRISEV